MDDQPKITTLAASGTVSSRFVSETDLESAKRVKEEQWKAAYARIGQEPPPKPVEEEYDPRSLYEKLSANKDVKREQWDEKMKMGNQWRGLEADELQFLAEVDNEAKQKEREKEKADQQELAAFKAKQTQSSSLIAPAPSQSIASSSALPKPSSSTSSKPNGRSNLKAKLKGIVVKKKDSAASSSPSSSSTSKPIPTSSSSSNIALPSRPAPSAIKDEGPSKVTIAPTSTSVKEDPSKRKRMGGLAGIASGSDSEDEEEEAVGPDKKKTKVD